MGISEKMGYVRGLADGLDIRETTPEGRLLLAIVDLLGEMAGSVLETGLRVHDLEESVDDLITDVYGEEPDGDSRIRMFPGALNGFAGSDNDEDGAEDSGGGGDGDPRCVACGNPVGISAEHLRTGAVTCLACGQQMTLEVEDGSPCGGGCCGHSGHGGEKP
ncbi:MAG: hypothetical protein FWG93_04080 [Oscillospiraceae bacterium]|nr:hypothetical protein [Oscillospiraceae bacterium]